MGRRYSAKASSNQSTVLFQDSVYSGTIRFLAEHQIPVPINSVNAIDGRINRNYFLMFTRAVSAYQQFVKNFQRKREALAKTITERVGESEYLGDFQKFQMGRDQLNESTATENFKETLAGYRRELEQLIQIYIDQVIGLLPADHRVNLYQLRQQLRQQLSFEQIRVLPPDDERHVMLPIVLPPNGNYAALVVAAEGEAWYEICKAEQEEWLQSRFKSHSLHAHYKKTAIGTSIHLELGQLVDNYKIPRSDVITLRDAMRQFPDAVNRFGIFVNKRWFRTTRVTVTYVPPAMQQTTPDEETSVNKEEWLRLIDLVKGILGTGKKAENGCPIGTFSLGLSDSYAEQQHIQSLVTLSAIFQAICRVNEIDSAVLKLELNEAAMMSLVGYDAVIEKLCEQIMADPDVVDNRTLTLNSIRKDLSDAAASTGTPASTPDAASATLSTVTKPSQTEDVSPTAMVELLALRDDSDWDEAPDSSRGNDDGFWSEEVSNQGDDSPVAMMELFSRKGGFFHWDEKSDGWESEEDSQSWNGVSSATMDSGGDDKRPLVPSVQIESREGSARQLWQAFKSCFGQGREQQHRRGSFFQASPRRTDSIDDDESVASHGDDPTL